MALRVTIPAAELGDHSTVWIDGKEYDVQTDGDNRYVDLNISNATNLITYTHHVDDPNDVHTQYPTGMRVWMLEAGEESYTARYVPELDNILNYAGASMRYTTGTKKGIRMLSAIDTQKKAALTGDGLAGFTMKEDGTCIAWADQISQNKPMVKGKSYVSSNYAYSKENGKDPEYAYKGDMTLYSNVMTGFSHEQCADDIAIRPYMILTDGEKDVTIYGGIVKRSIGHICYQIRNTYEPGSESYEFVWDIIKNVFGDIYDGEYIAKEMVQ